MSGVEQTSVILLFLDGVGIGRRDPRVNPFFVGALPEIRAMLGGDLPSLRKRKVENALSTMIPLDATLRMPGLPQSGTGQTALFTGMNGARLAGRHFGPYPYSTLRPVIEKHNIFRRLLEAGKRVCFANAFPERFFEYMARHPGRMTVTTLACTYAGVPIYRDQDLRKRRAVSADVTGEGWRDLGYPDMPVITPFEAGQALGRLSREFDFVLFEYWKTDPAGHAQKMGDAVEVLERLDALLGGIRESWDQRRSILVITSDHGNIEDLSTKTHTRHPVPFIVFGEKHRDLISIVSRVAGKSPSLCHVTPALVRFLTAYGGTSQSP
jgi:2,3-bisphosphoglycerate-independent phosphoglycerate mutase